MNIAIFLKTVFLYITPLVAASELESNISNTNLDKNKKKLFLYFDTSHTNHANKIFFHILLTSTKIWKRLMRRNFVLSAHNRAAYLDKTGNYVRKTCTQKFHTQKHVPKNFHLCVWFITSLNNFARLWARAHAIACLSLKRPVYR